MPLRPSLSTFPFTFHKSNAPLVAGAVCASLFALPSCRAQAQTAPAAPALRVDVRADRHPISPLSYGINSFAVDADFARELHLPISRWGGDNTTRYNWQVDGTNAGNDYYYMAGSDHTTAVPGASVDSFIDVNRANGSGSIVTIPIIDYVNSAVHWDSSFPVALVGKQEKVNPYVHLTINGQPTDAGNGRTPDGKDLTLTKAQILRIHVPNTPDLQRGWLKHLIGKYGTAAKGGVAVYEMDNEPGGWNNTHRDIHPEPSTYPEIIRKTIPFAEMVKSVDPTAAVLGPGDFGFPVYKGDPEKQNGLWNAELYLQAMAGYDKQHSKRILDYFDEHYYPTAQTGQNDAIRLESTRSLWDPTYVEKDWIGQWNGAIRLIPRMHDWVAKWYPGTKIAITEYNWGGGETLNGALAQADVLGIFGRERLDLATMWGPPKSTEPAAFAFRLYRNYDGKGATFGETGVQAVSTDQGKVSVYAAVRAKDNVLTVVVINKTGNDVESPLDISGFNSAGNFRLFRYSKANLAALQRETSPAGIPMRNIGSITFTYPANSMTLLEIPGK